MDSSVLSKPIKKKAKTGDSSDDNINALNGKFRDDIPTSIYQSSDESRRQATNDIINDLPVEIDGIRLLALGRINSNPSFHNFVQIFPLGYKAEVVSTKIGSKNKTVDRMVCICEIQEKADSPEFVVSVKSAGKVFRAKTEELVWSKFYYEFDRPPGLSFFNLAIELWIEGLPGTENCINYKPHRERGYGVSYFTQEQSESAKKQFILKITREQRTQQRQQARVLNPEELKQLVEEKRKQEEKEKELRKIRLVEEKEQRERDKEDMKMRREQDRIRKEEERRSKGESKGSKDHYHYKESGSTPTSSSKEKGKIDNKAAAQIRKDVTADIRRFRNEAAASILHRFDEEEEQYQDELMEKGFSLSATTTDDNIDETRDKSQVMSDSIGRGSVSEVHTLESLIEAYAIASGKVSKISESRWDDILQVSTCLHTLRGHLRLQSILSLDDFVKSVEILSASSSANLSLKKKASESLLLTKDGNSEEIKSHVNQINSPTATVVKNIDKDVEDDENEWMETEARANILDASDDKDQSAVVMEADAMMDRIQLSVVKILHSDLQSILQLDEKENTENKRRDLSRFAAVKLPLNQLTWPDIARMCLIIKIGQELDKSEEEIAHMIRGSRQAPHFRSAKNIIRNIRYRMATRSAFSIYSHGKKDCISSRFFTRREDVLLPNYCKVDEEDMLLGYPEAIGSESDRKPAMSLEHNPTNIFFSEDSIINELQRKLFSYSSHSHSQAQLQPEELDNSNSYDTTAGMNGSGGDEEYSDYEKRCGKVLLKILNLSIAKHFIWEVDIAKYPEYYETLRRPNSLSQIAVKLLNREYSTETFKQEKTAYESMDVVGEVSGTRMSETVANFYRDLKQVAINCFVYNTEVTLNVSQAQKLLQAVFRHTERWVVSPNRPSLDACDDHHCLLSGELIPLPGVTIQGGAGPSTSVRCGRCSGVFALQSVSTDDEKPGYITPSMEQVNQLYEDWYCPLCLRDDNTYRAYHLNDEPAPSTHENDDVYGQDLEGYYYYDEWGPSALSPWLLNPVHSSKAKQISIENPHIQVLINAVTILSKPMLSSIAKQPHSNSSYPIRSWNLEERVIVLRGLCELLKTHTTSQEYLGRIFQECQKLTSTIELNTFREAEFMEKVRAIAGDEGVVVCRSMMDGSEGDGMNDLMSRVIEGRCTVCRKSTYDDDCVGIAVILCDGCNSEAHLPCLNLVKVPTDQWYCDLCKERNQSRTDSSNSISFGDLRTYRRMEEEAILSEGLKDLRVSGLHPPTNEICDYCGMSELDLCSPMVFGQSRHEFTAHLAVSKQPTVDNFYTDKKGTTVKFSIESKIQPTSKLKMPFFPLVKDRRNRDLYRQSLQIVRAPIVHELCALRMAQARTDRSRYLLRRKRRLVAERVVTLFGVVNQPLGIDNKGRVYWRFPTSNDLFICVLNSTHLLDPDRPAWDQLMSGTGGSHQSIKQEDKEGRKEEAKIKRSWIRVSDLNVIKKIAELLGSSTREASLRQNLMSSYLVVTSQDNKKEAVSTEGLISSESVSAPESKEDNDGVENPKVLSDSKSDVLEDTPTSINCNSTVRANAAQLPSDEESTKPAAVKLIESKGSDIPRVWVIEKDTIFEEEPEADPNEEEDDQDAQEFFTFHRNKYYAVAVVDKFDRKVKVDKDDVVITMQIQRNSQMIAYTPLSEPWNDYLFYFCTPKFKRSGTYTISFIVEGMSMQVNIKPIVFPVQVQAKKLLCGVLGAFDRLRATEFVTAADRFATRRRDLLVLIQSDSIGELMAVKKIILTFYLALPIGSILNSENSSESEYKAVADVSSWNESIDRVWREELVNAVCAQSLMECLLLLEFYINNKWFSSGEQRLVSALPPPHFAIRCATLASVSLRIFSLDRAMSYEKTLLPGRALRTGASLSGIESRQQSAAITSSAARRKSAPSSAREIPDDRAALNRPRRAAAMRPPVVDKGSDDDDEDGGGGRRRLRTRTQPPPPPTTSNQPKNWRCKSCHNMNEPRARSCNKCDSIKPPVSMRNGSDEEEEEDQDEDSDEEEGGSDEEPDTERPVLRIRKPVKYFESADDEGDTARNRGRPRKRTRGYGDNDDDEEEFAGGRGGRSAPSNPRDSRASRERKRSRKYDEDEGDDDDEEEEDEGEDDNEEGGEEDQEGGDGEGEDNDGEDAEGEEPLDLLSSIEKLISETEKDDKVAQLEVLKELVEDPESEIFHAPVEGIPNYRVHIKKPMDLGTVFHRVKIGYYGIDHESFLQDLKLIWSNCELFNGRESAFGKIAKRLEDRTRQLAIEQGLV